MNASDEQHEQQEPQLAQNPASGQRKARHGGSVLMAAMLGLADALGHDREPVDIVQAADDQMGEDELRLTFGDLDSIDWRFSE